VAVAYSNTIVSEMTYNVSMGTLNPTILLYLFVGRLLYRA